MKSVDGDAGGGVTQTPAQSRAGSPFLDQRPKAAGNPIVLISGNSNWNIKGTDGVTAVPGSPEFILMHELVGHAIPIILGKMEGNAVVNENKVRREVNVPLRQADPRHLESNFGN
ncbi:hypothetical protein HNQ91_005979 [Filimonas zeae]|uniref:Uncharacterized protein n=1 Tax=Filimonas zeae TaxID=1737353 RepID=A0A917J5Y7_9BACT|nr:hypothetical protein [Filimonas zeae]MDR6342892.1 hypothetical protein [Filimonas zeae]GGH83120.1 hypothetical protein GCM10011379_58030 [Filimonas zeae]